MPVGLTKHREGLYPLKPMTKEDAREAIRQVDEFNRETGAKYFAFCSDEMYLRAGLELPPYEYYGGFDQIENGVGLFRLFEDGVIAALEERKPLEKNVVIDSVCGAAIAGCLKGLFKRFESYGIEIAVHAVRNDFFGESVTVSGLVTAGDIIKQECREIKGKALIMPSTMLREMDDIFLDGIRLPELSDKLGIPVCPMPADDGGEFVEKLFDLAERL